jgi:hypothetical protein
MESHQNQELSTFDQPSTSRLGPVLIDESDVSDNKKFCEVCKKPKSKKNGSILHPN